MPRKIDVYVVVIRDKDDCVGVNSVHRTQAGAEGAVHALRDPCDKCGHESKYSDDVVNFYSFPLLQ